MYDNSAAASGVRDNRPRVLSARSISSLLGTAKAFRASMGYYSIRAARESARRGIKNDYRSIRCNRGMPVAATMKHERR
ncbi:hypothetical protein ACS0PU_012338 [Formica fusca]